MKRFEVDDSGSHGEFALAVLLLLFIDTFGGIVQVNQGNAGGIQFPDRIGAVARLPPVPGVEDVAHVVRADGGAKFLGFGQGV